MQCYGDVVHMRHADAKSVALRLQLCSTRVALGYLTLFGILGGVGIYKSAIDIFKQMENLCCMFSAMGISKGEMFLPSGLAMNEVRKVI